MIEVRRTNVRPFDVVHEDVPFPEGTATLVVAARFDASCGCLFEFGLRADNAETAMTGTPCEAHAGRSDEVVAALLADRDTPTDELIARELERIGGAA